MGWGGLNVRVRVTDNDTDAKIHYWEGQFEPPDSLNSYSKSMGYPALNFLIDIEVNY
jgi:hypothetical protein